MPFDESTPALGQWPLGPAAHKVDQATWVIGAFSRDTFSLDVYSTGHFRLKQRIDSVENMPYSALWHCLANLSFGNRKAWFIGWRMRHAMERAGLCDALATGVVGLPVIREGKNKGKVGGKLTWNRRLIEVDLVCGSNNIKALDMSNFGLAAEAFGLSATGALSHEIRHVLGRYISAMSMLGVDICKTTSAQLGWHKFRVGHQPDSLAVNFDESARALERRAYFGGRNECYRLGDIPGTTFSLDIRSCYAQICRDEWLPAWLECEYRDGIADINWSEPHDVQWIADVEIETDQPDYPVDWSGRPIYPIGRFTTSLAWPELRHALFHRRVKHIRRAARYRARPVFKAFADWYFDARLALEKEGYREYAPALKAMFNSSLGYTARQKYEWIHWDTEIGYPYWLGVADSPESSGEQVDAQKLDDESRWLRVAGEPREAMPFLHATICSYARVRLLKIFAQAGRENILYVDTDGILCTMLGFKNFEGCPEAIGCWPGQLVQRFAPGSARIQGQKSYCVGDAWIQAGAVRSRSSGLSHKRELTTDTGHVGNDGRVTPFVMRVENGRNVLA